MRGLTTFLASTCTLAITAAHADVSDNLVFCSKLVNGKERIACYDAAARIAATSGPRAIRREPQPAVMVTAPAADTPTVAYQTAPQKGPFHGPYVAIGGGYGLGSPHNYRIADDVGTLFGSARPSGASAAAAAGYNLQFGQLVVGLELSGRYGREQFSDSRTDTAANVPFAFVVGSSFKSYDFNVDSGVHLALRPGLAIENTLLYGKIGVGAAHANDAGVNTQAASICFNGFLPDGSCTGTRLASNSSNTVAHSGWTPSVLFGLGIEQNFGPIFARIEGEAESIRSPLTPDQWLWTVRGLGMIGFRF